jgi:hypothetical protein
VETPTPNSNPNPNPNPTRYERWERRFKDHPVTSVLLFLSVIVTAAIPIFGIAHGLYQHFNRDPLRDDRVAAVRQVIDDLQRVQQLLPPDQVLEQCMKGRPHQAFADAYAACESQTRVNGTDAVTILDADRSKLSVFDMNRGIREIQESLARIRYLAYEMRNNYITRTAWRRQRCPDSVRFLIAATARPAALPHDASGHIRCVLSVETSAEFAKRYGRSGDFISPLVPAYHRKQEVALLIVPGREASLTQYFHSQDNTLYGAMLDEMERLKPKLISALRS